MVMYKSPSGAPEFYMNKDLKANYDILIDDIMNHKQDAIIVFSGAEGVGKSQSVRQSALYMADKLGSPFDREGTGNVYSNMEQYMSAYEEAKKKGIIGWSGILDESRAILGKARSSSKDVKGFTDWLSECRNIRGVHFILLPAYHDLTKYVALWRMRLLIHMTKEYRENRNKESGYDLVLGSYKVYPNDDALKACYKEPYNLPHRYAIQDRFPNVEVMTPKGLQAIEDQKDQDRDLRRKANAETGLDKGTVGLNGLMAVLKDQGFRPYLFGKLLGLSNQAINARLVAGRQTIIYQRWKKNSTGDVEEDQE